MTDDSAAQTEADRLAAEILARAEAAGELDPFGNDTVVVRSRARAGADAVRAAAEAAEVERGRLHALAETARTGAEAKRHSNHDLVDCAIRVRERAYAPYSSFMVGAAVRMDGQVFEGVNVEIASYPLCVCAERNAIAEAVGAGARVLTAVAVCTDASPPSSPCGGCRQVLLEFAHPAGVTVIAVNPQGERREWTLAQLLPDSFDGRELPQKT